MIKAVFRLRCEAKKGYCVSSNGRRGGDGCGQAKRMGGRLGVVTVHLQKSLASYIQLRKEKRGRKSRSEVGEATDMAPRAPAPGRYKRRPSGEAGDG